MRKPAQPANRTPKWVAVKRGDGAITRYIEMFAERPLRKRIDSRSSGMYRYARDHPDT